jgi:hypothetical protein
MALPRCVPHPYSNTLRTKRTYTSSPPADFPLLPSCSIDEAELLSITPLVALPSPAPDLWVSAGYDDESEDDEVLAP